MKKLKLLFILLLVVLGLFLAILLTKGIYRVIICRPKGVANVIKEIFYCPMHPNFTSDKPGSCAICGMNLVKKQDQAKPSEKKILYYRNPMDPAVTSPVPMKDSMGMDYVPVYAEQAKSESGVQISPEKQQLIGVTKEKIEKRKLNSQINTVGEVAYDPDLYVAQEEYIQALKTVNATKNSALASVAEQSNWLLAASEKKLLLLGMSKNQIENLAKRGSAEENLYLPGESDSVWVYITVYEYEISLIKEGQDVLIDTAAFPGEIFKGKVLAMSPIVNSETRALKIRAQVQNPEHKLKPQMFVNARINIDLPEKLAVSDSAVIDTGERKIVYVVDQDNNFQQRDVKLGQKAMGYFEVLGGLNEGDVVVTSGNFLVDSESKLKGPAQTSSEHQHGQ